MAWWDFGVRGRDDEVLIKSGNATKPNTADVNLSSFVQVGSVGYNASPTQDAKYSVLLLSTGGGTQIYLDYYARKVTNRHVYLPDEDVNLWYFESRIRLRKDGTEWYVAQLNGGAGSTIIAGGGSIYNYIYRAGSGDATFNSPGNCYPRAKQGGGTTNQIGMVSDSTGLTFYAVGFSCPGDTRYTNPAFEVGHIPSSILNNAFWFDPSADAVSENDYKKFISDNDSPDKEVDYDYTGDDIDFPSLPTGASAMGFGRMNIFKPTSTQLASALDILWSMADLSSLTDLFDTVRDVIVKLIYKPEQYCVSLMTMPIDATGSSKRIFFGKYDTQVDAVAISNQYHVLDCGSVQVKLKSGSSFDYSPYVKAMIFLPFIGFRPINVNEIMGGTVYVKYYIDMFTGASVCFVKIANDLCNSSVLYTYECNVASQLPITSTDYHSVINSLITSSASLATAIAMPNPITIGNALGNTAMTSSLGQSTPDVQTSGQLNPNTGVMGHNKPYIALHFPVQSVPAGFVNQNGYPSSVNTMLGNLSGYTEVDKIHLNISGAYEDDLNELTKLLKEGIIL